MHGRQAQARAHARPLGGHHLAGVRGEANLTLVMKQRYADPGATNLPPDPSQPFGGPVDAARAPEHIDGISIKLSALYPRYEDAHRQAVLDELRAGSYAATQ